MFRQDLNCEGWRGKALEVLEVSGEPFRSLKSYECKMPTQKTKRRGGSHYYALNLNGHEGSCKWHQDAQLCYPSCMRWTSRLPHWCKWVQYCTEVMRRDVSLKPHAAQMWGICEASLHCSDSDSWAVKNVPTGFRRLVFKAIRLGILG